VHGKGTCSLSDTPENQVAAVETGRKLDGGRRMPRLAGQFSAHSTLIAILVLVAGSVLLNVAHVRFYSELSPVDELQHIDYLYRAPELIRSGDKVQQDAMHEEACRGIANWPVPACSDTVRYDPKDFQELGTNTAAIYTPLYYTITKLVAMPLKWMFGLASLVTAARLVGGLWLAAGLVVTFLVARRFGAHPAPTVAVLLAAAATPNVLLPAATITPDAAALLVGASLVWSVLWWEESPRRRWWFVALLSLVAVAFKALNIIVVVLVALFLVVRYFQHRFWPTTIDTYDGEPRRRRSAEPTLPQTLACIAAMSVVAIAGAVGFVLFSQANAIASSDGVSMAARISANAFPLEGFLSHIGVFLQVFYAPGWFVTVPLIGPLVQQVVGLFAFAGTFAAAFLVDRVPRAARSLAGSLLVVGVVGAPMIIAFSYISSGMYVPIPGRYALTLVPAALAVSCAAVQRRSARVICVVVGGFFYLIVLGWLLVK
jgi:hypothetical protein